MNNVKKLIIIANKAKNPVIVSTENESVNPIIQINIVNKIELTIKDKSSRSITHSQACVKITLNL